MFRNANTPQKMAASNYDQSANQYSSRPDNIGTDALAFRALAARLSVFGTTGAALDVGCGTGRSTRFLKALDIDAAGLDINQAMLAEARRQDPTGKYVSYNSAESFPFPDETFDLVLSTWAVLEIGSKAELSHFIGEGARILKPDGRFFIVTNTLEFYSHRWVSCDVDFPENRGALQSGRRVTARLMPEGVIVHDYFWSDTDYREAFSAAGLTVEYAARPTAPPNESGWLDETRAAPYIVYELAKNR